MRKKIEQVRDHVILCGYKGQLPRFLLNELLDLEVKTVVISEDPEDCRELIERDILFIEGNPHSDGILKEAGITRARTLLALMDTDAHNVFTVLSARSLSESIRIMTVTEMMDGEQKLYRAGANYVVSPHKVMSSRMVQQLLNPYVNDFLEIASDSQGTRLILEQVVVPRGAPITSGSLQDLAVRQKTGVTVAGLITPEGRAIFDLLPDTVVGAGTTIVVLGTNDSLEKLEKDFIQTRNTKKCRVEGFSVDQMD